MPNKRRKLKIEYPGQLESNTVSKYCHSELHADSDIIYAGMYNSTFTYLSELVFDGTLKIFTVWCGNGGMVSFGSFGISALGGGFTGNGIGVSQRPISSKRMCSAIQRIWRFWQENYIGDNFREYGGIEPPLPVASATTGSLGSTLTIDGSGFGASKGSVLIGDVIDSHT